MAKGKRQQMTEKRYESIKELNTALTNSRGKAPTHIELAALTATSGTTVGRILNTKNFEEYKVFQAQVAHSKNTIAELRGEPKKVRKDSKTIVIEANIPPEEHGQPESQEIIVLTRIAIALEGLLEAWQSGGKRRFGK